MQPRPGARTFGAFGASLATHLALFLLLAILLASPRVDIGTMPVMSASLKYIHAAGAGGGGGGSDRPIVNPVPAASPPPVAAAAAPAEIAAVPLSLMVSSQPVDMPGSVTGLSAPIALAPGNPGGPGPPGGGVGPGTGDGVGPGRNGNTGGDEFAPGDNVTIPRLTYEKKAAYTSDAVLARVQGVVELEAVVMADGTVARPRVVHSLHPGLDQRAIDAVLQWRFAPGRRRDTNQPVNVVIRIQLAFSLR